MHQGCLATSKNSNYMVLTGTSTETLAFSEIQVDVAILDFETRLVLFAQ